MVEKKTVTVIRETKEIVFNILKNNAPGLFGDKTWNDIDYFGVDTDDPSYFKIMFNEE